MFSVMKIHILQTPLLDRQTDQTDYQCSKNKEPVWHNGSNSTLKEKYGRH